MDIQKATDAKLLLLERRSKESLEEIQLPRAQQNTHAAVSKLPDNVLLEIFMVLKAQLSVKRWHHIAHVCRRWRHVAVEAPMLWTNPPTDNHPFALLVLRRSKMLGLTVFLGPNTSPPTGQAVLACMERIESLMVETPYDVHLDDLAAEDKHEEIINIILESLRLEAPRLKTVHLRKSEADNDFPDCSPILQLLHPLNSLHKMHLQDISVDWNFLPIRSLVYLRLEDIRVTSRILIQQFVDILRQMPLLETLSLPLSLHVFDNFSPEPEKHQDKLTLACLRDLESTDCDPNHVLNFLRLAAFPQLRRMELNLESSTGSSGLDGQHYSDILEAIAYTMASGDFGTFDSITIAPCYFRLFMSGIIHERPRGSYDGWYPLETPYIGLSFPNVSRRGAGVPICTQFALDILKKCQTNSPSFRHLDFSGATESFVQLLGSRSCLSLQTITMTCTTSLITSLATILAPHDSFIPFPYLKAISSRATDASTSSERMIEALHSCMLVRRQHGCPLHQLTMEGCHVNSSQRTRLEQAVVSVIVK